MDTASELSLLTVYYPLKAHLYQLFLNGAINLNKYGTDMDGIDRDFGINSLGHKYLLALQAMDSLSKSTV